MNLYKSNKRFKKKAPLGELFFIIINIPRGRVQIRIQIV